MFRRFLQSILILLSAAPVAFAQIARPTPCIRACVEDCGRMPPCPRPVPQVVRTSTRVRADLDGRVVRYEISETFVNRGGTVGEADYMLPLPKGAAFEDLALSINGEMVTGETMTADRARAVYEEIVRKMRDPALVEWMGHGLLRTRIFPIQPGEEKRVVVRFHAIAEREGDALRLDWLDARRAGDAMERDSFTLTYGAEAAFGEPYSPTHALHASRDTGRRTVSVEGNGTPLTILVPVRTGSDAAISLLAHAPAGEDGYALITLSPPMRTMRSTPRDVTFVLDVSGSMSGRKMEQARAAGRQLVQSLTPADRFRLIDFSSDVRSFRDGWTVATGGNVRAALEYLDGLRANGGTNIQGALQEALAADTPEGRLSLVLLLTDGAPTIGEQRPEAIARRAAELRRERRVFTFGIGADVNAGLLEQLALQGRGTATFVRPEESVERAVGIVTDRLARPVVTDVRIHLEGARVYGLQPQGTIDLFAGQDLVVLARYAGTRERATLTIDGRTPDGPVRWTEQVSLPARSSGNAFIARLWAVQRVGYLSAERRRGGGNAELDAELRQLGERYGIPTELTSYLVVEPGMRIDNQQVGQIKEPRSRAAAGALSGSGNAAPAPTVQFEAARKSSEAREARSLADMDAKDERGVSSFRAAGTHSFKERDGVWMDTQVGDNLRLVKVKAYSPAYFALLRRMPELAPLFAVGERVRVNGRRVAIEIGIDGIEQLDDAAIDAVAKDW